MKKDNFMNKLQRRILVSSTLLAGAPLPAAAFDDSGRTSHFWVTFRPQAGSSNSASDDVIMRNGYREETLSSNRVSCSRSESGNQMLYDFTLNHNIFDGGTSPDVLKFQVSVEAFSNTTVAYSSEQNASSLSLVGRGLSAVTDIDNAWGVGDDFDVDENETLRFTLKNFSITDQSLDSLGYQLKDAEVIEVSLKETNGGHTHRVVFGGVGNSESSHVFNTNTSVIDLEGYKNPFYMTGAGSGTAGREWAIESITCKFRIVNPSRASEDTENYFSDTISGHLFEPDLYPATSRFRRNQSFPQFSWNTVPRALIIRKRTAYTDSEIQTIANNYGLIMLEKANDAGLGSVSAGMLDTASRLKAINPQIKIIFYWNSLIYFGHYGIDPSIENPTNFNNWIDPELTLRDGLNTYNRTNTGMLNWWVSSARTMMSNPQIDATFIDKGSDTPDSMLDPLVDGLPFRKFTIGNFLRTEFVGGNRDKLIQTDGSYFERWKRDRNWGPEPGRNHTDTIATQIAMMQEMAAKEKIGILKVDDMDDTSMATMEDDVDYELAIFLIGAGKYSYFSYQASVDARKSAFLWETSYVEEFMRRLGFPLDLAARDGAIFTRSFQFADVTLDTRNQTANIVWR